MKNSISIDLMGLFCDLGAMRIRAIDYLLKNERSLAYEKRLALSYLINECESLQRDLMQRYGNL